MKLVKIHTDGGCEGNPGPGGWGAVLENTAADTKELSGGEPATTNNRMELQAAIEALKALREPCEVELFTDSQYLREGITKWISGWKARGWRTMAKQPVKNEDLWRALDAATAIHRIQWRWLKGHAGHAGNERCDVLAGHEIGRIRKQFTREQLREKLRALPKRGAAVRSSSARTFFPSFMITIPVDLGPRSYSVLIGSGMLDALGGTLRAQGFNQTDAFVITNAQVAAHYFESAHAALEAVGFKRIVRHDIPASEEGKNWEEFSKSCAALLDHFPDAGSIPLVFLLGGGVVGDLGGFAAAVFRRGVPFIQIPTTLLAAVDSSVGGKVAVNFGGVKNIMGVFNQPRLVFCDLALLKSLSPREIRSGASEVIKYGAVCSEALFRQLEDGALEKLLALDPRTLTDIVAQCVRLKADVVQQDEYDKKGIRNVLNFGHTIGHALELSADYALTHGEAISIGMVAATRLALALRKCDPRFLDRLSSLLARAGLPTQYPNDADLFERILRAMQLDKKFRDGKNLFVLPTGAGSWEQQVGVDWRLVHEAIRSILSR